MKCQSLFSLKNTKKKKKKKKIKMSSAGVLVIVSKVQGKQDNYFLCTYSTYLYINSFIASVNLSVFYFIYSDIKGDFKASCGICRQVYAEVCFFNPCPAE